MRTSFENGKCYWISSFSKQSAFCSIFPKVSLLRKSDKWYVFRSTHFRLVNSKVNQLRSSVDSWNEIRCPLWKGFVRRNLRATETNVELITTSDQRAMVLITSFCLVRRDEERSRGLLGTKFFTVLLMAIRFFVTNNVIAVFGKNILLDRQLDNLFGEKI